MLHPNEPEKESEKVAEYTKLADLKDNESIVEAEPSNFTSKRLQYAQETDQEV